MTKAALPSCRHRGAEFAPGRWTCGSPRLVVPKGVTEELCCKVCPYVDHDATPPPTPATRPPAGCGFGVAIGTYDSLHADGRRYGTESVELNLAVLRATCGRDLRILVCDDGSPPASQRRYRDLCAAYGAEFTTNAQRMGHTSGDMIVFHKAIEWAGKLGLRTVTKISHRLVIEARNWVQDDSERLLAAGFATMAQMLANFGIEQVRTECVMMAVDRWYSSDVLRYFRPRPISYWNESLTFHAISRCVDSCRPYPHFLPWGRLSFFRGDDCAPVYFHEMRGDADAEFRDLARRHSVRLTDQFSTVDSCGSLDYW